MRRLICLLWGILFAFPLFAARDTLSITQGTLFAGDTVRHLNLFRSTLWHIKFTHPDGKTEMLTTGRPDTALSEKSLTRASLSTSLRIPPALLRQVCFLNFQLEGSLEIRQNNRIILGTGVFQQEKRSNLKRLTQDQYYPLYLEDTVQRLDLVYVPRPYLSRFDLALDLYPRKEAERKIQNNISDEKDAYGKGLYYLAFGIVFFVFYIFFREKVENLYFSLFCICAAFSFLSEGFYSDVFFNVDGYPGIFSFEFLAIFFCKVLKNRERSRVPLIVISVIALLSFLPFVRYSYTPVSTVQFPWILTLIYIVLYVYVTISCVYYLMSGVGQKRWEAKTILIFCLVPIALLIVATITFIVAFGVFKPNAALNSFFATCLDYFVSLIVYVYPLAAVFILGRRNGFNQKQLIAQVASIQQLSEENLQKEQEKKQILEKQNESLEREVALRTSEVVAQKEEILKQHNELKTEKKKSDDLLLNILPEEIAEELKQKGHSDAKLYDNVTVLFADFVDFTKAGESMTPQMLVNELHTCFKAFDEIIGKYQIEKIKTIGDAYLAVCGLPLPVKDHAAQIAGAAIEIRDFMATRRANMGGSSFEIRIGIHSGPVVAGIVGVKKFAYDIWGDTVNTAARMEQSSDSGYINISEATHHLVHNQFECTFRGDITAKNKGALKMYYVEKALQQIIPSL